MKTSINLVAVSTQPAVRRIRRTRFYFGLVALVGLCASDVRTAEPIFSSRDLWPPLGCGFASTNDTAVPFTVPECCTIYVRRFHLANFYSFPLTGLQGTTATYNNIVLTLEMSTNGINWSPSQANGRITIKLDHTNDSGATRLFALEILQMSMSINSIFGPVMIRESPTLQSLGETIITTTNGGYLSSSPVSARLELSTDGGATWLAGSLPADLDLFRPPTVLSVSNSHSGSVQICWTTQSNAAYQLQWTDSVDSTNWSSLGSLLPGTGSNVCVSDSVLGQEQRFYRVQSSR